MMDKVMFFFFFAAGLVLLYLTILLEHQFMLVGFCR